MTPRRRFRVLARVKRRGEIAGGEVAGGQVGGEELSGGKICGGEVPVLRYNIAGGEICQSSTHTFHPEGET